MDKVEEDVQIGDGRTSPEIGKLVKSENRESLSVGSDEGDTSKVNNGHDSSDDEERRGIVENKQEEDPAVAYWHLVAKESSMRAANIQIPEKEEMKEEHSEKEKEDEHHEQHEEAVAAPEPTLEEKAKLALTMVYWQEISNQKKESQEEKIDSVHIVVATETNGHHKKEEEEKDESSDNDESHHDENGDASPVEKLQHFQHDDLVKEEEPKVDAAEISHHQEDRAEKHKSNVEVLTEIANEMKDEEDKSTVRGMLDWAKKSRKPKSDTFVIRAKKKEESFRRAVDFSAMNIVIEDKTKGAKVTKSVQQKTTDQIFHTPSPASVQPVQRGNVAILSDSVVPQEWIVNAIKSHEQEQDVELVDVRFEKKANSVYVTHVKAKIGPAASKEYHWVIREVPKVMNSGIDPQDKDTYMLSDLGNKIVKFVAGKKFRRSFTIPFQAVILADQQFAVFEEMDNFTTVTNDTGFDLDHMKQALRALAKLHAMSYAYFNQTGKDGDFSEVLKLLVDPQYQPSASPEDKAAARAGLDSSFDNLLHLVRNADARDGADIAARAKTKFGNRLYDICRDANDSSGQLYVLCHGFPSSQSIHFLYGEGHRPIDVKFIGFQLARFAHAATDLQLLMCTSLGPNLEEQTEFLIRYVYYETLMKTLNALDGNIRIVDYELLLKEFKSKQVFGCLMGAMHLAGANAIRPVMNARRAKGTRVFESKLVGGKISGSSEVKQNGAEKAPSSIQRAKTLLEKALTS